MKKMKTDFMTHHPLRETLTAEDWGRIKDSMLNETEDASFEELDAMSDRIFDTIAVKMQTHISVTTLQ